MFDVKRASFKKMLTESSFDDSIYQLVKTVEFDIELDGASFPIRVELLQCLDVQKQFRTRTWVMKFSDRTCIANFSEDQLFERSSDEGIFVDYSNCVSKDCSEFQADSQEVAIQLIVNNLKDFVSDFTGYSN